MRPGHRVVLILLCIVSGLTLAPTAAASAAEPAPTGLTLHADRGYADTDTAVAVELTDATGAPVAGAQVTLERRMAGSWTPLGIVTTDAQGRATQDLLLSRVPADNVVRGTFAGDDLHAPATAQVAVALRRRGSQVVLGGPTRVVDGRSVAVTVRWRISNGTPVAGRVLLYRSLGKGPWRKVDTLRTNDDGRAQLTTTPREDSRWRATAVRQAWVEGDRSSVHRIDNRPAGRPVHLPQAAPHPRRKLRAQPHAAVAGANVVVTPVPDHVWHQMTGVSWHQGCPVGRSGLRLVRVNYWDYAGYARRGELVASADAAGAMGGALAEMFRRKLPIRAMYRVDRFGWGRRSTGANDYASMSAGNTSAFNCRDVTGSPGVRSPHSYGRSLDVNTWENPYRSARGTVPNTWWQGHSHPRVAWRSRSHPVVRLMARHGLRWTYGLGDTQHFDYVGSRARASVRPRPCDELCDRAP